MRRSRPHHRRAEYRVALGPHNKVIDLYKDLQTIAWPSRDRNDRGPGRLPGTDTCKLGIASARGLAVNCARVWPPNPPSSIRRSPTCGSKSPVASTPAASIMWPTLVLRQLAQCRRIHCPALPVMLGASGTTTADHMPWQWLGSVKAHSRSGNALTEKYVAERQNH